MDSYSLADLPDSKLLQGLLDSVARERLRTPRVIDASLIRSKRAIEEMLATRLAGQMRPKAPVLRAIPIKRCGYHVRNGWKTLRKLGTRVCSLPRRPHRLGSFSSLTKETHDKLRIAQDLLGHSVPSGDLAQVLDRALTALFAQLETQKFAATKRPRAARRNERPRPHPFGSKAGGAWARSGSMYVRLTIRTSMWSRRRIEFDHIEPVARGGRASVNNIRLRCRAHNQYEAERTSGAKFMERRRAP